MKITTKQAVALHAVATTPRINLAALGRSGTSLLRRGLLKKDWHANDAVGERIMLTKAGRQVFRDNFC